MRCLKCGRELPPSAKFCAGCGHVTENAFREEPTNMYSEAMRPPVTEPVAPNAVPTPEFFTNPAPAKAAKAAKKTMGLGKKIAIGIGGVVAAAGVTVGTVFLVQSLSPKGRVDAGMDKSVSAHTEAFGNAFGGELSEEVAAMEKYSMDLEIEVTGGSEIPSEVRGVGVRYGQDVDMEGREIGVSIGGFYGGMDVVDAQVLIDDSEIYVGMEELLGEGLYGVNTETIGKDLVKLGVDDGSGMVENIGFNIFDLVDAVKNAAGMTSTEAWDSIWKDFTSSIEAKKDGSETIEVNGNDVKCTKYKVVISEDAMVDLVNAVLDTMGDVDYTEVIEVVFEELGLPNELVDEFMSEMDLDLSEMEMGFEEMSAAAEMALGYIGDIELDVYIDGGKLMAAVYENEIEGVELKAGLYLGGGDNYVDDWSVVVEVTQDDETATVELVSTGNHAGEGGQYTDETVMRAIYDEEEMVLFTSEVNYDYEAEDDNFEWILNVPEAEIVVTAAGTVDNGGGELYVDLDKVSVEEYGDVLVEFAVRFWMGSYEQRVTGKKQLLLDMSETELMAFAEEVQANAEDFLETLEDLGLDF